MRTADQVATMISNALWNQHYLLIVDGLFSAVNLQMIGILMGHEHGKVIVSSRMRTVCHSMNVDAYVKVEGMSRDDAWELFRKNVGNIVDHPRIRTVAQQVLRECGEFPLSIIAVARALRNENNESKWRDKLDKLQSGTNLKLEGMEDAFNAFKLAYDKLGEDQRSCFLYGAMFPEDYEIPQHYIIECCIAEEFIHVNRSFTSARDQGGAILKELVDTSLLDRSNSCVKMPRIFRTMAMRVMDLELRGPLIVVEPGSGFKNYPAPADWSSASADWKCSKKISLISNDLQKLPEMKGQCYASSLLIQRNNTLHTFPESLAASMCSLRVLDLFKTGITSLPHTISKMVSLVCLFLNGCICLDGLPGQIAQLENLKLLDIRSTNMRYMPMVVKDLSSLKCLRVSFPIKTTSHSHGECIVPNDLISKLQDLEELVIAVHPTKQKWIENIGIIVTEVAKLRMLTTLNFYFPSTVCFEKFSEEWESLNGTTPSQLLRSFKFFVGNYDSHDIRELASLPKDSVEAHMRFSDGQGFSDRISRVILHVTSFELIKHTDCRTLTDFGLTNFSGMKILLIKECMEFQRLVDGNTTNVLPYLEKLCMTNLPKLDKLWDGELGQGSFARLKRMTLKGCSKLETLFHSDMMMQLSVLEILRVEECLQMHKIIEDHHQPITILNLQELELVDLPTLATICSIDTTWTALKRIEIRECTMLTSLPCSTERANKLKKIECSKPWWLGLVWTDNNLKSSLTSICRFS